MRNPYEVRGPVTYIKVRDAGWNIQTVMIDTEDLEKVKQIKGTWRLVPHGPDPSRFYIEGFYDGRYRLMHRVVMGLYEPNANQSQVFWRSANRLDLRKSNLGLIEEKRIQLYRDAIALYEERIRQLQDAAA